MPLLVRRIQSTRILKHGEELEEKREREKKKKRKPWGFCPYPTAGHGVCGGRRRGVGLGARGEGEGEAHRRPGQAQALAEPPGRLL